MIQKIARAEVALRDRAEDMLRRTRDDIRDMDIQDVQELVHELQVHKIELRMQNEALRLSQENLEASRQKYMDLYDYAPVGYLTLDRAGAILEANLMAAKLLGCPRNTLTGKKFSRFVSPGSQDAYYMHFRGAVHTGVVQSAEIELIGAGDPHVQLNSLAVAGQGTLRVSMSDITALKKLESGLKQSA